LGLGRFLGSIGSASRAGRTCSVCKLDQNHNLLYRVVSSKYP